MSRQLYICIYPGCNKTFKRMDKLLRHTEAHSIEEPHEKSVDTDAAFDSCKSEKSVVDAPDFSLPDYYYSRKLPLPKQFESLHEIVEDLDKAHGRYIERQKMPTKSCT